MGILKNPRHELFAQELAKGKSATEAYTLAGYKACRKNAARLTTFDDIRARLSELQAQVAKKSEVTVERLLDELEHARQRADGLDQLSAAVKAISEKAKISGLLVQKLEVGGPGSFDGCDSFPAIADRLIAELIEAFRPVDASDRQALIDLLTRQANEVDELLASIRARPITAERVDPAKLTTPWQQLQPHSPRRLTNGSHR